jgi:hypothetical protein
MMEQELAGRNKVTTYFIQSGIGGPIKIGIASDVNNRLRSLQCAFPYKLRVVATISGNHERMLHKKFSQYRMMGEWFKPKMEIIQFIEQKCDVVDRSSLHKLTSKLTQFENKKPTQRHALLTESETARYIAMSRPWLRLQRMRRTGPAFIKISRSVRYDILDLDDFLRQRIVK